VIVVVSGVWQTTCTAVRAGDEGFVIDSPVDPDELDALPRLLEQAGFPVSGLLATHADWDHLLGRLAFPEASLGRRRVDRARLAAEPGERPAGAARLRRGAVHRGPRRSRSAGSRRCRCPAGLSLGDEHEIELHPADGHTADGTAYWLPWARCWCAATTSRRSRSR
jgi:glyoxylase-like metal-dependent hydrolase (beta-lactamase superfamily II)